MAQTNTQAYTFRKAKPIWIAGEEKTMNLTVDFRMELTGGGDTCLSLAASTNFIVRLNGELIGYGPARCAHGFYYVDEYDLSGRLLCGQNVLTVRVAGYNINTYATLDQPSFLCAELTQNGRVIAFTGENGTVTAARCSERVMKIEKYSFQRPFAEAYILGDNAFSFETDPALAPAPPCPIRETEDKRFLVRQMPYGNYLRRYPTKAYRTGRIGISPKTGYYSDRMITRINDLQRGYLESELELPTYKEYADIDILSASEPSAGAELSSIVLEKDTYIDIRFDRVEAGIFEFELLCEEDGGKCFIAFDEILSGGDINPCRLDTNSYLEFVVQKGGGIRKIVCSEPYTVQYARLIAVGARMEIRNFRLVEIAYPKDRVVCRYAGNDETMQAIFDAAVETFAANAVDGFSDCPSRERAGWLGDSFFTARVSAILTGDNTVEETFLNNFLLPDSFGHLPRGMLPMCYPSDHDNGEYIPTYAMWFVLQIYEYATKRGGDTRLIRAAKDKIYGLIEYFAQYENEWELLSDLRSWIFIDWSHANDLIRDLSFPSNMLYSEVLRAAGELYGDRALIEKSERMKHTIRHMAMTDSGFFCDNMVRRNGQLILSGECTEACQYYAFFCGVATPDTHPWLWKTLIEDFGFERNGIYPEIAPANIIMGNFLRLDLLARYGYDKQLCENIKGYYGKMAALTGTLWEHTDLRASCSHACAAHVVHWMNHLGLIRPNDPANKAPAPPSTDRQEVH